MTVRLADARALVTGATGGLGQAIARELAARSCEVILTGRRETALERLATELGPPARWLVADLMSLGGARDLLERSGPVDVLVANAGVEASDRLEDIGDDELERAVAVNLLVPLALARDVIVPMTERGRGHVVFISSIAGVTATPGNGPVYTATKWGLRGFGLALRQELRGTGVGVSTIFPGPIRDAGMFARTGVALPRGAGTSSPADVARAVTRAIERDLAEVRVAAGSVRLSAVLSGVSPVLVGSLARRAGAGRVREGMIAARKQQEGETPDR
jgi:short-subunit dehydrogenase